MTSWLFSPMSMKPRPRTTSPPPSAVTAPRRISWPSSTSATSPIRTGAPFMGDHDDAPDFVERPAQGEAVDQVHLAGARQVAAADGQIVRLEGVDHLLKRHAVLEKSHRLDADLILPLQPAPRVDFRHAGNGSQGGANDPVLHDAEVVERHAGAGDRIMEHLAQPGGHRAHLGPADPGRQFDGIQAARRQAGGRNKRPFRRGN